MAIGKQATFPMPQSLPKKRKRIVATMPTVDTSFDVPEDIREGLDSGQYERVGGVIRDLDTKQIVAWLRENQPGKVVNFDYSFHHFLPFLGVLNLAVSVGGFALVLGRLKSIEDQLRGLNNVTSQVNQKIDFQCYANLTAAIQQANSAFLMSNPQNRHSSAMQAIDRLLVAEHYFSSLFDEQEKIHKTTDFESNGRHLLSTICLAYTAEALCYMELDEPQVAISRVTEAYEQLRQRCERFCYLLLMKYDAPYLHPYIMDADEQKDVLSHVWGIYQWRSRQFHMSQIIREQNQKFIDQPNLYTKKADWTLRKETVIKNLDFMEAKIEESKRLQSYQTEIEYVISKGFTWREWCAIKPKQPQPDKSFFLIIP